MAVSLNGSRTRMKRSLSLSLDAGLNTDQVVEEGFKSDMSRKSCRKTDKKARESDRGNTGVCYRLSDHNSPSRNDGDCANTSTETTHSRTQASMHISQESVAQHNAPDIPLLHLSVVSAGYTKVL